MAKKHNSKRRARLSPGLQFLTSGFSTMMVLVLLGMVVFFVMSARNLSVFVRENLSFSILLSDDMNVTGIMQLKDSLDASPFVKSSVYISKEQALAEETEAMGMDPAEFIGYNPYTASIEIKLKAEYANIDSIAKIEKTLGQNSDINDIIFGVENGIDFIACSFTSKAQDIIDIRNLLKEHGDPDIDLIAKIESQSGVNNIDEILEVANGIMVARGDLGVEVPYEELPQIQKMLINKCRLAGKRCITATEMLESMINQPRPTRAEISDVANAVYDGTSAVMLSGETAAGKYPAQAVEAMAKICLETEKHLSNKYGDKDITIQSPIDALSHSACVLAEDIGAKAIVVCSRSGGTARKVSRFRPTIDVIGMTIEPRSYRKLALSWGVIPVLSEEFTSMDVLFYHAKRAAVESGLVQKGDRIVITGGNPNGKSGNSNVINIEQI